VTTPYSRIMREKRALIWPIVAALVINIALFALVVYPLSQKVASGEEDAAAAAEALRSAKAQYQNARSTVTGKSQADDELRRFYEEILPPDIAGARRISYLRVVQLAQQTNLRFETQTATPSEVRDSNLGKWTQTAVLTGAYRDIRRFVHQLETAPEFLVIERVDLKQSENEANKGITVTVQLATYYRAAGDGD
jgi:Tfp pilus assembly protein PilO